MVLVQIDLWFGSVLFKFQIFLNGLSCRPPNQTELLLATKWNGDDAKSSSLFVISVLIRVWFERFQFEWVWFK